MRKMLGSKSLILILGVTCVLALVLLAAGISSIKFKPGTPFAYITGNQKSGPAEMPPFNPFRCVLLPVLAILVAIYFLLPRDQRKKYLWDLLQLVLLGIVLFFIIARITLGTTSPQPTAGAGVSITPLAEATLTPIPTVIPTQFVEPPVSPWLSYLSTLALLLAIAGVWFWLAYRRRKAGPPLDELAGIARETVDDLEAGKDWGDTVLNCYFRMTRAVESWRHIRRHAGMTPAEFAGHLASTGLPGEAVAGLTAVFERVRYGGRKSTREDVHQATDCLTAILKYCEAK